MSDLPRHVHAETLRARDVVTGQPIAETIVWADRVINQCPLCRQPIDRIVEACPAHLNAGAGQGGQLQDYSQQHGCGEWLAVTWRAVADGESVEFVAAEIAASFTRDLAEERASIRRRLTEELADAMARLAKPLADGETAEERAEEITTGSDTDPGVYRGDGWLAWEFDPLTEDGTDCITVYAERQE